MMEYALEEDIPDEFKGGTLEINFEDTKIVKEDPKIVEDKADVSLNNEKNQEVPSKQKPGFMFPLTQKITETFRPKKIDSSIQQISTVSVDPAINFFTFREGTVETAVNDCIKELLQEELDGQLVEKYLLTEINLWDSNKERLVILTEKSVICVKYDFIALKRLEHRRVGLQSLDSIVIGNLVYPSGSLVPRLNGIADGVTSVLQTCLFQGWSRTDEKMFDSFQARERNTKGIRLMWNKGKPLGFSEKWNPFKDDVPICTLTSHPLYHNQECTEDMRRLYDLEHFEGKLRNVMATTDKTDKPACLIHHKNIVLQNYVGIGALIHNRNSLGFFKVRGRFSF